MSTYDPQALKAMVAEAINLEKITQAVVAFVEASGGKPARDKTRCHCCGDKLVPGVNWPVFLQKRFTCHVCWLAGQRRRRAERKAKSKT